MCFTSFFKYPKLMGTKKFKGRQAVLQLQEYVHEHKGFKMF